MLTGPNALQEGSQLPNNSMCKWKMVARENCLRGRLVIVAQQSCLTWCAPSDGAAAAMSMNNAIDDELATLDAETEAPESLLSKVEVTRVDTTA